MSAVIEQESFDPVPMRENILRLEAYLKTQPQVEIKPVHYFAPGLYAREIVIPKGAVVTGHIHRCGHLNIISKGEISVLTESGVKRLKAPCTLVSHPGIKRAGFAHEETVWTTIHATTETDIDKIEALLLAPSFEALEAEEATCLSSLLP